MTDKSTGNPLGELNAVDNSGTFNAYFNVAQYADGSLIDLSVSAVDKYDNISTFGPYLLKINITDIPSTPSIISVANFLNPNFSILNSSSGFLTNSAQAYHYRNW